MLYAFIVETYISEAGGDIFVGLGAGRQRADLLFSRPLKAGTVDVINLQAVPIYTSHIPGLDACTAGH